MINRILKLIDIQYKRGKLIFIKDKSKKLNRLKYYKVA